MWQFFKFIWFYWDELKLLIVVPTPRGVVRFIMREWREWRWCKRADDWSMWTPSYVNLRKKVLSKKLEVKNGRRDKIPD